MRNPVPLFLVLVTLSMPITAVGTVGSTGTAVDDSTTPALRYQSVTVVGDHAQLEETPNRLVLTQSGKTEYVTPTLDFGMQLANQDESIRSDYRSFSFESRFSEFENDTARSEAIETELERIDDRIRTLRDREREAATAHADHNASETVVTRALARNYYEALELRQALEELETHAESVDDQSVPVRDYTAELGLYTSPLREEISERLHGVDDSERAFDTVLLETSQDGLVLSAIDTDTKEYVREATRYDNRDLNRSDQIETIRTARDTAVDLYPWAFESTSGTSSSKYGAVQLYRVEATAHPQGRLTVYLDGGTGTVSHERQTLDFDQIPPKDLDEFGTENLSVRLTRVEAGTPAKVTVTDPESGDPLEASVSIDGAPLGETGEDGELWVVPPTEEFELNVRTADASINETVS